jgi:RNA polymerase sigma factor (sigma-70 family)
MMQTEIPNIAFQDSQTVAAVRQGEADRYRELVERHERRVFAIAWSRLGDLALAEDATQEAFLLGYRRLWLLGNGTKYAAWITAIVRHVAINLGLRRRRELNKCERWALEQPPAPAGDETPELCTPETLRQTLAELPAAHRESLVLFYLEDKSGAETATALGISEAALRVRLHRARAALRERLEEKLADSLARLRPAKSLVPAIMAGVLASSSAKAATAGGAGAAVLGALAKFGPVKWVFGLIPFTLLLPATLVNWLMMQEKLHNFRDQEGFRARLFRDSIRWWVLWFTLMMAGIWMLTPQHGNLGSGHTFWLLLVLLC